MTTENDELDAQAIRLEQADEQAEDWLAAFNKKSNEALAKMAAAAGKKVPPDEKAVINALARKDHTEYDRVRGEVAKELGIRKGTLDEKVEARREELRASAAEVPAHWDVVMAADEVDGAELLDQLKASATVIRMVEEAGKHEVKRFSTWAPKAIALIKGLPDTLADRSVIVHLMRKPSGATVQRLRKRDSEEFRTLRGQAARWAQDHSHELVDADPDVPEALHDRAADNWRPLLAIADLAGGHWSQLARQAACELTGAEQDSAVNVTLLSDIKTAFADAEVMRSADLVAKLVADPESPWAEYSRGKPLTQRQLARLLRDFQIIPETVHPPGLPDGKGYKRVWFEELWAAYCPNPLGQNPPNPLLPPFDPSERPNADGSRLTGDFSSVRHGSQDGSKSANLSYSHAGLDAWTDQKTETGAKRQLDQKANPPEEIEDGLDIPDYLRRTAQRCDHCGGNVGILNPWDWPGRPDGIWLHPRCEAPWVESEGGRTASPVERTPDGAGDLQVTRSLSHPTPRPLFETRRQCTSGYPRGSSTISSPTAGCQHLDDLP